MNEEREEPISRAGRTQDHFVRDIVRDVMSPQPKVVAASAAVVEAAEACGARYRSLDLRGVVVVHTLFVGRQARKVDAGTTPAGVLGVVFGGAVGCFFCLVIG